MKKAVLHRLFVCRTTRCVATAFCLLCCGHTAFAQTDTTAQLTEVQVTAKRAPELQTAAVSQKLSANNFLSYNALTVADAVRNFAGVNLRDYGGIGGLKTVSVRSLGANHTVFLIDGVAVNNSQNGQIDIGRFNLFNIDEVALYIPQPDDITATARAFSAASVLAVKTTRPRLTPNKPFEIKAGIKAGSFGLIQPWLQWQQRLGTNWRVIVNGYRQTANGKYYFNSSNRGSDTSGTRLNGDVETRQADGAVYYGTDDNGFYLRYNYNDTEMGVPGPVITDAQYLNQRLQNRDMFIQGGFDKTWDSGTHLLLRTKLTKNYQRYTDTGFLNNRGGLDDEYTLREFYQSAAISVIPVNNLQLAYAADINVAAMSTDAFRYAFPTRTTLLNNIAAKYAAGRISLSGNLLYTYVNDAVKSGEAPPSKSVFSPALTATYRLNTKLMLRAFYKNIFRYPTLSDQYYYTPNVRLVNPEYVNQYNAGAVYTRYFGGMLSYLTVSADAYYNHVKDKIIYLPSRSPEMSSVRNLGSVDISGLDVNIKTFLVPSGILSYSLSAAYTLQKAVDVTDAGDSFYLDQIPYTPLHSFNINGGVVYRRFSFNTNLSYASARYQNSNNEPGNYVAPYALVDVSAAYTFRFSGNDLTLMAEGNNILGTRYEVVRYYPMPQQSARISLQITL